MKQIGYGAYSTVYIAPFIEDKVFKTYAKDEEKSIDYYILRELCLLKSVNSPYIIKFLSYDIENRTLTLPRYKEDLHNRINRKGIMDVKIIKKISQQIAMAIYHIHSNGIVHRDIKPHNVLINDDNEIVLIDFGISRVLEWGRYLSEKSDTVITSWYRPPEIFSKMSDYSYEVDIWSFGCIIAEMFLGEGFLQFASEKTVVKNQIKLFGFPQYFNDTEYSDMANIKYNPRKWEKMFAHIEEKDRAFLKKFFNTDYKERITIDEILNSNFFDVEEGTEKYNYPKISKVYEEKLIKYTWDINPKKLKPYEVWRKNFISSIFYTIEMNEFFRCIDLLDSTLSRVKNLSKEEFFYYAYACLFMASKLESVTPMSLELLNIKMNTDIDTEISDSSKDKIIEVEKEILKSRDFNIINPTLNDYFSFYMKDHNIEQVGMRDIKSTLIALSMSTDMYRYSPYSIIRSAVYIITGDKISTENGEESGECLDWIYSLRNS